MLQQKCKIEFYKLYNNLHDFNVYARLPTYSEATRPVWHWFSLIFIMNYQNCAFFRPRVLTQIIQFTLFDNHFWQFGFCVLSKLVFVLSLLFVTISSGFQATPQQHATKRNGLFCTSCDSTGSDVSISEIVSKRRKTRIRGKRLRFCNKSPSMIEKLKKSTYGSISQGAVCATSTPACKAVSCVLQEVSFTPKGQERNSMSPITKSTHHMCRAMQVNP